MKTKISNLPFDAKFTIGDVSYRVLNNPYLVNIGTNHTSIDSFSGTIDAINLKDHTYHHFHRDTEVEKKSYKTKYTLMSSEREYQSDSLIGVFLEVLKHRFWHFRMYGKWED